ncbi:MAG TPA: hypothetical protein K8W19_11580 [Victivallis vadensis]|nr:hypothetical protein [Victivallis vadensis]
MELPQGDDLSTFSKAGAGELRNVCKKSQKSEEKDGIFRKDGLFLEHSSVHTAVNPVV